MSVESSTLKKQIGEPAREAHMDSSNFRIAIRIKVILGKNLERLSSFSLSVQNPFRDCFSRFAPAHIREEKSFVSPEACRQITSCKLGMERSQVRLRNGDVALNPTRTSLQVKLIDESQEYVGPEELRETIEGIYQRLMQRCPRNGEGIESLELVYYPQREGKFDLHHDALDRRELEGRCQRVETILVYLNTVKRGGETEFPVYNRSIQPEEGKIVQWSNCSRSTGVRDEFAVHQGNPTRDKGGKWILAALLLGGQTYPKRSQLKGTL